MRKEVTKQVKPFRILKNSIRDSFKSVFRNFSLSIASVICTTITLILVAIAAIVTANVNYVTKAMEEELTIVVYANRDTDEDSVKTIEKEINKLDHVEKVTFKGKEEWKLEMKNYSETLQVTLDYLDNNPLLDSFIVKVDNVENLSPVTNNIRKIENVESANYGEGMVEEIISAFNIIKTATIAMVIALVVVTAFLISNTIKLTIYGRRSEIEIMRLVGSSNITIKLPFIFEGLFLGFVGSLIPIIVTIYGYVMIYDKVSVSETFSILELIKPMPFVLYVSLMLVLIGCVVGMLGSARAVKRYLKV